MREFNEHTVTEAVLQRIATTPDPRLRDIMTSFITHIHDFVREVRPTWEEWLAGIQFLTAVGQKCDDNRQEFILLSDTLGVSMLVDFINYGKMAHATESTVLGPFYVEHAPALPLGSSIARHASDGDPCVVTGSVCNLEGTPLPGAVLDVWQAGGDGFYDVQKADGTNLRAQFQADTQGKFWFRAVCPSSYPVPVDGPVGTMLQATNRHAMRPGHLHFVVSAPGHARLVTHLFINGAPYLESDAVFAVKESLVVDCARVDSPQEARQYQVAVPFYRLHYDFVLKPVA